MISKPIYPKNIMPAHYLKADQEFKNSLLEVTFQGILKVTKQYVKLPEQRIPTIIQMLENAIKDCEFKEAYEECQFYLDLKHYTLTKSITDLTTKNEPTTE